MPDTMDVLALFRERAKDSRTARAIVDLYEEARLNRDHLQEGLRRGRYAPHVILPMRAEIDKLNAQMSVLETLMNRLVYAMRYGA